MNSLFHRSPSVGSITKKIIDINPDLNSQEIIKIVRAATGIQGVAGGEYASIEIVDERRALELAKATLTQRKHN